MNDLIMTVGLEVHVELKTETKIFCSCKNEFGAEPNSQICPVCMGFPGALPRLNHRVVEYAVRAGLATNCKIATASAMDRKNYFYPDLPKAFQISQNEAPLCSDGYLDIETEKGEKRIGIMRIHIEEDAGKLVHTKDGTLIDYNRCGTPLIEIVSAPQIHSAEEAKSYLKKLRSLLLYTKISDCKMNEGSMRCDVNISVAPRNSNTYGTRTEIKNINSISFVAKAIDAEYRRQCELLESGGTIECETRRYNEASGKTELMRKKESTADYRFFGEPDLMKIRISPEKISDIASALPILPHERIKAYTEELGLSLYDSRLLAAQLELAEYFEQAAKLTEHTKVLANLLLGEAMRLCRTEDFYCPIRPCHMAALSKLYAEEKINSTASKKLMGQMWSNAEKEIYTSPEELAEAEQLWQINDETEISRLVHEAIAKNPRAVSDYKNGKSNALKSILGAVMAASRGRANPTLAEKILINEISY